MTPQDLIAHLDELEKAYIAEPFPGSSEPYADFTDRLIDNYQTLRRLALAGIKLSEDIEKIEVAYEMQELLAPAKYGTNVRAIIAQEIKAKKHAALSSFNNAIKD